MRIISGKRRGLKLKTLDGENTRPTMDRVKESLFNILTSKDIEINNVLDLFAGSGNLGIEALSRGAKKVLFCDNSKDAVDIIKENINKAGFNSQSIVFNEDYENIIKNNQDNKFDLIFLDPPYNKGMGIKAINSISKYNILSEEGIIVLETNEKEDIPKEIGMYINIDERKYGTIKIRLYKRKE